MRHWLRPLSAAWKERLQGHKTRSGTGDEDDDLLISQMMLADNGYILASSSSMLPEKVQSATDKITQCDLEWKVDEM